MEGKPFKMPELPSLSGELHAQPSPASSCTAVVLCLFCCVAQHMGLLAALRTGRSKI